MKKVIIKILDFIQEINLWLIVFLIITNIITGFFTYLYFTRKPDLKIKIVEKTKIAYKTIYRDYNKITKDDCIKELQKYDISEPKLDGYMENKNIFFAEAGLNNRTWNRRFKLKVNESNNWKYYVGAGVIGASAGGFIIYNILK
jgi:hypothetical protein